MKRFMNKKVATIGLAAGLALGAAGAAFAYFSSSGSGTGSGTVGSSQTVTVVQDSITYNGPGGTGVNLQPGDTATVAFGITNPGGNQYVNQISLTGFTSNKTGCASADTDTSDAPGTNSEAGWITMVPVTVGADFGNGTDQTTGKTGTVTFHDESYLQDVCQGASITLDYSSN